jgi:hypothetical protein
MNKYVTVPYEVSAIGDLDTLTRIIISNLIEDKSASVKLEIDNGVFKLHYKARRCRPSVKMTEEELAKIYWKGKV